MINLRKGDKFKTLKSGEDIYGKRVKKGSTVTLYDLRLSCNPLPYGNYYLSIKGVTSSGQLIEWGLDESYIQKMEK